MNCRIYSGDPRVPITGVCDRSSEVSPGDVFVAVKGLVSDGHDYIPEAVLRGARAVITQRRLPGLDVAAALAQDSKAAAGAACFFHDYPSRSFALAGVTGTNGKTTVCHLLSSVWEHCGYKPGMIGTVEIKCGSFSKEAVMTTPGAASLQKILSYMRDEAADRVCMEVSSHSINQQRVAGCEFDAAVFTNITPEHLDYHGDMKQYAETKKRLFTELLEQSGKKKQVCGHQY